MAGVGDQQVPGGQPDRLGREPQGGRLGRRRLVRRVPATQGAPGLVLGDQLGDQAVQAVAVPLPGQLGDQVALRVDDGQRRPGAHRVGAPGAQLRVVEDRMVDAVPLDRGGERHRIGLVHELRRVDADDDEDVAVLLLQRPQLVQHVQAVDAAEGPEVHDQDATSEVGERVRLPARVEPAAPTDQLWGTYASVPTLLHLVIFAGVPAAWSTRARSLGPVPPGCPGVARASDQTGRRDLVRIWPTRDPPPPVPAYPPGCEAARHGAVSWARYRGTEAPMHTRPAAKGSATVPGAHLP